MEAPFRPALRLLGRVLVRPPPYFNQSPCGPSDFGPLCGGLSRLSFTVQHFHVSLILITDFPDSTSLISRLLSQYLHDYDVALNADGQALFRPLSNGWGAFPEDPHAVDPFLALTLLALKCDAFRRRFFGC
jgi:hypothetical protein